jgi:TRAP-type C4-dicarboxylate transport system permease small subunit
LASSPPGFGARAVSRFVAVVDALALAGAALAALALAATCVMMGAEVFARYALNTDLPFSWEYSGYLMSAVFFLGAAYALRSGTHIRLGLLNQLPWARARFAGELAATALGLAVAALVAWSLGDHAWQAWVRGAQSYTPMQTPLFIPQAVPAIGAALLCLQLLARLAAAWQRLPLEVPPDDPSASEER